MADAMHLIIYPIDNQKICQKKAFLKRFGGGLYCYFNTKMQDFSQNQELIKIFNVVDLSCEA